MATRNHPLVDIKKPNLSMDDADDEREETKKGEDEIKEPSPERHKLGVSLPFRDASPAHQDEVFQVKQRIADLEKHLAQAKLDLERSIVDLKIATWADKFAKDVFDADQKAESASNIEFDPEEDARFVKSYSLKI